jgi:hypothetical protein
VQRTDDPPLSFAQQRLWFLDQLEPGSSVYNCPIAIRLRGELHMKALSSAISEIVRRHEVLRTRYKTEFEDARQHVQPSERIPLAIIDLTNCGASSDRAASITIQAEGARPFDLTNGPVLRSIVIRLSTRHHILCLVMHHIATDGWSATVLLQELSTLYRAYQSALASPLPDLPINYADYAVWQRRWLGGPELDRQIAYWRDQLSGLTPLRWPVSPSPHKTLRRMAGTVSVNLRHELAYSIESLSRTEGTTVFMTLLATWHVVLRRWTGQTDFAIGTDFANRNRAETEPLIGFFVNQLVFRLRSGGDPSFCDLLARVRETALKAYANQNLPFERLVQELAPSRSAESAPLFQVKLIYQNMPSEVSLPDLEVQAIKLAATAKMDLILLLEKTDNGIRGELQYDTALFDKATMERVAQWFVDTIKSFCEDPGQRISAPGTRDMHVLEAVANFSSEMVEL